MYKIKQLMDQIAIQIWAKDISKIMALITLWIISNSKATILLEVSLETPSEDFNLSSIN